MSIINLPMLQQAGYQSNPSMGPPNYRQADDLARSCSNCTRFKDGFCDKYATKVDDTFVCDAFQPANDETGPLADIPAKQAHQKLTPRQAFKVAFLMNCLDEGLSEEEIRERAILGVKMIKAGLIDKEAALVEKHKREVEYDVCPHCKKEIYEKHIRCDKDGKSYHRDCDGEVEYPKSKYRFEDSPFMNGGKGWHKQALDPFYLGAPLAWLASGAGRAALAAGVAIPMGLGAAGGYSAAKLTSDVDKDIENVKDQEILDTYSHLADDAERKAKIKRKLMGLSANQPLLALKTNKGDQPIQPMA